MATQRNTRTYSKNRTSVYIRTFGCQMNVRDSEYVMGLLLARNFHKAESMESADIILFNSCSVRKHAEDRLISNIAELKKLKKIKPDLVIGLMGCTAQNYKEALLKKLPLIDFVCGPGNESDIPEIVEDIIINRCPIVAVDKVNQKRPEVGTSYRDQKFKALVSIGEGCDNYCSYCVVPYVRGRERSRSAGDIIAEIRDLADRGYKEIMLLGQNVNSFGGHKDKNAFISLLEKANAIKGIERIRFMTSHPKDAGKNLFKAISSLSKVCEHLHLPVQSGSDRILKLMNRKYTRAHYLKLVEYYKKILPQGSLTTDIIVGFPSETGKDFCKTMELVKKAGFDNAFTFKYSPRPPAKAAQYEDSVSDKEKKERLASLMDLQAGISKRNNELLVGRIEEILVDGVIDDDRCLISGRTRTNKLVVFEGDKNMAGALVSVRIDSVRANALQGRLHR